MNRGPDDGEDRVRAPPDTAVAAGPVDLLRLGFALATGWLRSPARADPGRILCRWAHGILAANGGDAVRIRLPGRVFLLAANGDLSRRVLESSPAADAFLPGRFKQAGISFLAPRALTISHGVAWTRLRRFNEQVLDFGDDHPFARIFLERIGAAFARPVASTGDVREAMGKAMSGIVLGEAGLAHKGLATDVHTLFRAVQSPLRRKLLGFRYRPLRERLYVTLRECWRAAGENDASLLGLARRHAPAIDEAVLIEQIPHWMFTFTGSGTDLLSRTMALVTSRPRVHERVLAEIASAGPPDEPGSLARLPYTEACLLETGRLFPPAAATFHQGDIGSGPVEIVHYFPILHRDGAFGPTVDDFLPERWVPGAIDAAAAASCLFLRGPRSCPGRGLILFVCKAALARQLDESRLAVRAGALSDDPLPVSFPEREARFQQRTST